MTANSPLKNARHEAFCQRVAAGEPLGEAWERASLDVGKEPPSSFNSAKVSGSRMASKLADRIAAIKQARADARNLNAQPVTRESIHVLLEEVTSALTDASRAASRAGADGIAQQLHKNIIVHAGRSSRASARAPSKPKIGAEFDSRAALVNLKMCDCDD